MLNVGLMPFELPKTNLVSALIDKSPIGNSNGKKDVAHEDGIMATSEDFIDYYSIISALDLLEHLYCFQ